MYGFPLFGGDDNSLSNNFDSIHIIILPYVNLYSWNILNDLRWLLQWGSPLTIPNREVKPISADGTANGGRVGRCLSLY